MYSVICGYCLEFKEDRVIASTYREFDDGRKLTLQATLPGNQVYAAMKKMELNGEATFEYTTQVQRKHSFAVNGKMSFGGGIISGNGGVMERTRTYTAPVKVTMTVGSKPSMHIDFGSDLEASIEELTGSSTEKV